MEVVCVQIQRPRNPFQLVYRFFRQEKRWRVNCDSCLHVLASPSEFREELPDPSLIVYTRQVQGVGMTTTCSFSATGLSHSQGPRHTRAIFHTVCIFPMP